MHRVPFLGLVLKRNDEVAGFLFGLFDGIHEDYTGAGDGGVVEFALMRVIGADGVDVGTFGDVVAIEDGLGGSGCGVNDVGAAYGLGGGSSGVHWDAEAVGHFGTKVRAGGGGWAGKPGGSYVFGGAA